MAKTSVSYVLPGVLVMLFAGGLIAVVAIIGAGPVDDPTTGPAPPLDTLCMLNATKSGASFPSDYKVDCDAFAALTARVVALEAGGGSGGGGSTSGGRRYAYSAHEIESTGSPCAHDTSVATSGNGNIAGMRIFECDPQDPDTTTDCKVICEDPNPAVGIAANCAIKDICFTFPVTIEACYTIVC